MHLIWFRLPVQQQHLWCCSHHPYQLWSSICLRDSLYPMVPFKFSFHWFSLDFSHQWQIVIFVVLGIIPRPIFVFLFFAALYLMAVSVLAGFWGQFFIRKLITILRRASLIVFILSGVIFASALTMGTHSFFQHYLNLNMLQWSFSCKINWVSCFLKTVCRSHWNWE